MNDYKSKSFDLDQLRDGCFCIENALAIYSRRLHGEPIVGAGIIVTKRIAEYPFDLTPDEWLAIRDLVIQAREYLDAEYAPVGYTLGWNCGRVAGQTVGHAHLHIVPRFDDDGNAGLGIRYWLRNPPISSTYGDAD